MIIVSFEPFKHSADQGKGSIESCSHIVEYSSPDTRTTIKGGSVVTDITTFKGGMALD